MRVSTIDSPLTLMTNLSGGRDVTAEADMLLMLAYGEDAGA